MTRNDIRHRIQPEQFSLFGVVGCFLAFLFPVCATGLDFSGLTEMNPIDSPTSNTVTAITNVRLVDGHGGVPIQNACVVVAGCLVTYAGEMNEVSIPESATRLDGTGKTVLPGLIDSHFHARDRADTLIEYELKNGITSLRDPGHPFKFYQWIASNHATIPRVFLCGGHLDAFPPAWPNQAVVISNRSEAREAVDQHVDHGASAIKIYMRLPIDLIQATCDAARARGVPVTAHLELVRADAAIRAGVSGIEHITSFGTALASDDHAGQFEQIVGDDSGARREWRYRLWQRIQFDNNPKLRPLIELIKERGVFVSPTLAIFENRPGSKESTAVKIEAFENMLRFFSECHRAGAKIVVGSHTNAPAAAKGKAYLRELELMSEAGMTPLEIITAATKTNSEFFGIQDRLGTIEKGKQADLILVDGDPTRDIREIDKVSHVMISGRWTNLTGE